MEQMPGTQIFMLAIFLVAGKALAAPANKASSAKQAQSTAPTQNAGTSELSILIRSERSETDAVKNNHTLSREQRHEALHRIRTNYLKKRNALHARQATTPNRSSK